MLTCSVTIDWIFPLGCLRQVTLPMSEAKPSSLSVSPIPVSDNCLPLGSEPSHSVWAAVKGTQNLTFEPLTCAPTIIPHLDYGSSPSLAHLFQGSPQCYPPLPQHREPPAKTHPRRTTSHSSGLLSGSRVRTSQHLWNAPESLNSSGCLGFLQYLLEGKRGLGEGVMTTFLVTMTRSVTGGFTWLT